MPKEDQVSVGTAGGLSRRTVVRTAAWTAPVVSVVAAAPAFAAASNAYVLTAQNNPITVNAASGTVSLQALLTSNGAALPAATVAFATPRGSWITLQATASADTNDAGIATLSGVAFNATAYSPGALATVDATFTAHDNSQYTATFRVLFVPNLLVSRMGGSSTPQTASGTALSSSATAVFVDEFTTAGAIATSPSISMPTSSSGSSLAFVDSGSASSDGTLVLSQDGAHVSLAGYNATVGTTNVASSGAVARVVGVIDKNGTVDTTTGLGTSFTGNNVRGAVISSTASGVTPVWVSGGSTGIVSTTEGASGNGTVIYNTKTNTRVVQIFNGELYFSTSSAGTSGATGVYKLSGGLATAAGQTHTFLAGAGSPYGFVLLSGTGAVAPDTLYVADDGAGLIKFGLVGGSWVSRGTLPTPTIRGLTGYYDPVQKAAVLFAVTSGGTSSTSLAKIVDAPPLSGDLSSTSISASASTLVASASNTVFRGVAFKPYA